MNKNESVFDILNQAKRNDGIVYLYNYDENTIVKNNKGARTLMIDYFMFQQSMEWLIMELYVSSNDVLNARQRSYLKRLDVKILGHGISFNAYELFKIPKSERKIEAFDRYIDFFNVYKEYILTSENTSKVQFLRETKPLRVEVSVRKDKVIEDKIKKFVYDDFFKDWFYNLAKGLTLIGVHSWFTLTNQNVLNFEEAYDFEEKRREKRKIKGV